MHIFIAQYTGCSAIKKNSFLNKFKIITKIDLLIYVIITLKIKKKSYFIGENCSITSMLSISYSIIKFKPISQEQMTTHILVIITNEKLNIWLDV